jgi:hypothetical protein
MLTGRPASVMLLEGQISLDTEWSKGTSGKRKVNPSLTPCSFMLI